MRRVSRLTAVVVALALAAVGCRGDEPEDVPPIGGEEAAAVESEPDEEPEEPEDPYAVPDEIDEAYAELVINKLLEIRTEALILALEHDQGETLDSAVGDILASATEGHQLRRDIENFQRYVDVPEDRDLFHSPDEITAQEAEVLSVLHSEPERCIVAVGWWHLEGTTVDPPSEEEAYRWLFSLALTDGSSESGNPTPWKIRHIGAALDEDGNPLPEEMLAEIDLGDGLDRTCEDR